MTTAQQAMDEAVEGRREVANLDGRLGALEQAVAANRAESHTAHTLTQRMIGELAESVAHLKGAASALPPPPPPEPEGPSVTLTPAKVVGAAKWVGALLGVLGFGGVVSECAGAEATQTEAGKP